MSMCFFFNFKNIMLNKKGNCSRNVFKRTQYSILLTCALKAGKQETSTSMGKKRKTGVRLGLRRIQLKLEFFFKLKGSVT